MRRPQSVTVSDGGEATVHWSESVGKAVLVSDGLPSIAEDESYELWFVRDGGPISAGTFDDGKATRPCCSTAPWSPATSSRSPSRQQGGSPTGRADNRPDRHDPDGLTRPSPVGSRERPGSLE